MNWKFWERKKEVLEPAPLKTVAHPIEINLSPSSARAVERHVSRLQRLLRLKERSPDLVTPEIESEIRRRQGACQLAGLEIPETPAQAAELLQKLKG